MITKRGFYVRLERYGQSVCMELLAENQQSPDSSFSCRLRQIERERGRSGGVE